MDNINVPGAFAKNFKCPCCQNPWNQGDSLNNTTDTTFIACQPCLSDNKGFKGLDPSNFDPSVPVGENFFLWSNGGWKKNNPIPNEYSSWNTFIVLRDLNLERLKVILDDLLSATTSASSEVTDADIEKVKLFYAAFMNEEIIESNDAVPIFPILDLCGDIVKNPAKTIAALHSQYGVNGFFALGSMPDKANSELTIASLYQSGLGLPDRDYYFDADKKEKRLKYVEYIASLFDLLKDSLTKQSNSSISSPYVSQLKKLDSKTLAEKVLTFETELASHHLTRTACRDPNLTYNKLTFNDVIALSKQHTAEITWQHYLTYGIHPHVAFDWKDYFNLIGKSPEDLGDIINLQAKHYLVHLPKILNENADILPYYSIFHVLNSYAPHLSSRWVNAHFLFHEKELKGTSDLLVRWKRGLQALESALGEALGKLYVQRHFPTEYKQKALDVVYSVRDALQQRLTEIPWMSEETKTEAFLKMNKFKVKIGYPDHWKDYSNLNIYKDQHVANVIASRSFEFQVDLHRMNAPTDKARWFMTPQTVNAYFHPSLNEIVFPAAILQPPFFDAEADVAVQFGSLGAVVGHEMTHGYDDQGRKYDSNGNLRDWWTKADGEEYERRAAVMVKQAEKFEVYGLKLNGKLTCGENIADLGGVKLALRALKNHLNSLSEPAPLINGLTPYQRFFLAWSQSWRENVKKERAIQLVTIDPHGPNELRCNGTLSNTTDFYEAFGITEKDRMFIPEAERVEIW